MRLAGKSSHGTCFARVRSLFASANHVCRHCMPLRLLASHGFSALNMQKYHLRVAASYCSDTANSAPPSPSQRRRQHQRFYNPMRTTRRRPPHALPSCLPSSCVCTPAAAALQISCRGGAAADSRRGEASLLLSGRERDIVPGSVRACACLRACVHACLPACLHACLPACLHACMPACLPACMPARIPCLVPAATKAPGNRIVWVRQTWGCCC